MKPNTDQIRNVFHVLFSIPIMYTFNSLAGFYTFNSPYIATLIFSCFFGFGSGILWEYGQQWAVKAKISKTDIYLTAIGFHIGGFLIFLNNDLTWVNRYVTPLVALGIVIEVIRVLRIKYRKLN